MHCRPLLGALFVSVFQVENILVAISIGRKLFLRHLRCDVRLQNAFQSDAAVCKVCKLLFALPFLPASDIVAVFERIERKAQRLLEYATQVLELCTYVRQNWLESGLWSPDI